jgi:hypothetical protein
MLHMLFKNPICGALSPYCIRTKPRGINDLFGLVVFAICRDLESLPLLDIAVTR